MCWGQAQSLGFPEEEAPGCNLMQRSERTGGACGKDVSSRKGDVGGQHGQDGEVAKYGGTIIAGAEAATGLGGPE